MSIFIAKSIDGKLNLGTESNRYRLQEDLRDHPEANYRIERMMPTRTLNQNRYYWLYLGVIERETGNSARDLHEYFKRTHLKPRFIQVMGKEMRIPSSTSELSKLEMSEYLDKICAETNIPLPDPTMAGFITNY